MSLWYHTLNSSAAVSLSADRTQHPVCLYGKYFLSLSITDYIDSALYVLRQII